MVCLQSKFGNPNNMGRWRMPTQAVEEYLESIYKMEKRGLPVIGARLAEELGVSPPTVAEMLTRLLSLIHISEPTRLRRISYAVFCLKKKKKRKNQMSRSQPHTSRSPRTLHQKTQG